MKNEAEPRAALPNVVPLAAIVRTEELERRPSRPPDYEAENRALATLIQALADSPATILETLAEMVLRLVKAGSAGLSLLTKDGRKFYWAAIAGEWAPHRGGGTPRDFGPCGDVLDRDAAMLFTHWERRYSYLAEATPLAEEGLLIPFRVGGKAVGTIWAILHDDGRKFDLEDRRLLESLGRFASAAYQAVQLQHAEVLINELNHRVKNTLATVQSIAAHTLTAGPDMQARRTFDARLVALSRTHNLLARGTWEGASLRSLLLQELEPFQGARDAALLLDGPDLELRPKEALALGLAFHELVTNAAKYGGLSTPEGRIRVIWDVPERAASRVLQLTWSEMGGPLVAKTAHRGFGMMLIERGLSLELAGDIAVDFKPDGLVCAMKIPLAGEGA